MARKVVEHNDFSGGDWGRLQPWKAPQNSFKAVNMLIYSTGELGVRPGLQNVTPTNVVAGSIGNGMLGDLSNFYYGQGTSMRRGTSYKGQTQSTMGGAFTGNVNNLFYTKQGSGVYYIMDDVRGLYSLISGGLTQLTANAGNGIAFYGDRLCFGSYVGVVSNLRYNGTTAGVSDLTNWPATNIIPFGDKNERPTNLYVQRGHLTLLKATNGFFVLTGQLSVNEALRRAVNTVGPSSGGMYKSANTETELIWFIDQSHHIPANFDGTQIRYYEDQPIPVQGDGSLVLSPFSISDPNGVAVAVGSSSSFLPFADTAKLHLFYHGAWTRHELPNLGVNPQMASTINISMYDPGLAFGSYTSAEALPYSIHDVPAFVFADSRGTTPAFYSLLLDTDRPGFNWAGKASDFDTFDAEMPGDNSTEQVTGTLELPEMHLKDTDEFMVQGVVVDFRSWDTRGTLTNHFDIQVDCLRPYDNNSPITSLKASWDEVGARSSTGGTVKRRVFMFGDQGVGNGYQLKLTNIRGVAFQRFQVILDTTHLRGI